MQNTTKQNSDLQDSPKDKKSMRQEDVVIDLPDVEDIPGQENISPAPLGELADVTISSADEEGDSIFGDSADEDIDNSDAEVTEEEVEDLRRSAEDMPTEDSTNLRNSALDNTDEDGSPLNEGGLRSDVSGKDLDVPGEENDDENEEIGEEDEENNEYSLGGDNHDQ
ncbi:MAG: hypothetical protein ABJA90_10210 [Ginsengibacter sp.]